MTRSGPLLQTAVFCESVIEAKDGTLSIIRIIDRLTVNAAGPGAPHEMPPIQHQLTAVLTFKGGDAQGRVDVRVEMEKPSVTDRTVVWEGSMLCEGPDRGQNFVLRLQQTFDLEGLYWFHVYVGDETMTRIPFRLLYLRQS